MGARLFRRDPSSPTGASSSTSPPRSSAPAVCISTTATCASRTAPASPLRSSTSRSTWSTTTERLRDSGRIDRPLPAEDPDGRGGGALERPARGARAAPRAADRHDQGLRPRRADRGGLSVDGDPRRAGPPLRRLQHRAVGLHQQRRRRDGVGPGLRQSQYRRHRHDLRLHAQLRGPRAPGGEHARPERPVRALAGRHGAQHPGRLRGGRRRGHAPGEGRRRARAARRGERQVGGALEDGAHRAAGVGEGRRRQPARTRVSAAHLHTGRTPTGWCCSSRRRAPSGAPAIC